MKEFIFICFLSQLLYISLKFQDFLFIFYAIHYINYPFQLFQLASWVRISSSYLFTVLVNNVARLIAEPQVVAVEFSLQVDLHFTQGSLGTVIQLLVNLLNYTMGALKNPEFIYKKCNYSYMFKLQSPSKCSPLDAIHLPRLFSTAQNSLWTHRLQCCYHVSFNSSTSAERFPLRTFFTQGNNKKSHSGQYQVNRAGGAWRSCCFWSKTAEYSVQCGQARS